MAKKIIRAKQTYAGSDGTGYFRGENGKYYYGNAQNGYVTKTLDQQRRDADEAAIQAQTDREQADIQSQIESYHAMRYARDHSPEARQARAAVTFAAGVSLGAFLAPVFYIFACLLVMSSLLDTWPTLLEELFFQYASGRADAATVLHTVNALAVMALFVWNLRGAWAGRQRTRWFAVPAVLLTSALYMAAETIGGPFYPFHLIFHAAYALQLASLPALILYYVGFRRSGGRQFLRGIAQRLWDLMPGHGATMSTEALDNSPNVTVHVVPGSETEIFILRRGLTPEGDYEEFVQQADAAAAGSEVEEMPAEEVETASEEETAPAEESSGGMGGAIAVVIVVVLAAGGAYVILKKKKA